MRIITGKARGVRLETLPGLDTRPTAERAKEAIFSMLAFDIEGRRVLDLFAGSGQMGLEALSRGARSATFVDISKAAVDIIKKNVAKTRLEGVEILCADSLSWLGTAKSSAAPYDIVFLDPPYGLGLLPDCLRGLLRSGLLKEASLVVCESGSQEDVFLGDEALESRFETVRSTRYGVAFVNILKLKCGETDER